MVTPTRTWQYKRHTGQNNSSARPLQNNDAKSPKFVWFENAAAHIRYAEVEVWRCKRSHARHSDWNINKYSNRHLPQRSHPGYYITSVWRWGVTESWGGARWVEHDWVGFCKRLQSRTWNHVTYRNFWRLEQLFAVLETSRDFCVS